MKRVCVSLKRKWKRFWLKIDMIKNIVKVLLSNSILTLVGLLNSLLFPVLLSVSEYAYYQEYILYTSYVNICHLGIASGMFLTYAGKKYKEIDKAQYKSEVYLICIVLCAFTVVGLGIGVFCRTPMFFYVVLSIIPQCIIASFQALYQAWERFTGYAIVNVLPKVLLCLLAIFALVLSRNISGDRLIIIYVCIIWCVCIYFLIEFFLFTRKEKAAKIFSEKNKRVTIEGFLIMFGNYVNLLFHSIDKQFVSSLYSEASFAFYSFAMSMQNLMLIFITALANPFYPRLAKGDVSKEFIGQLKELLLMFGAFSGCAYFAVAFVVKCFIEKYVDSLQVVAMFFAVFPAMAVINVLYINMYKIKRKLKKYILTLAGMLGVSVIFNIIAVLLNSDYIGISLATMLSYYVWLFYSQKDFEEICITKKDYVFLFGFFAIYILSMQIETDLLGIFLYAVIMFGWCLTIYKETIIKGMRYLIQKRRRG